MGPVPQLMGQMLIIYHFTDSCTVRRWVQWLVWAWGQFGSAPQMKFLNQIDPRAPSRVQYPN